MPLTMFSEDENVIELLSNTPDDFSPLLVVGDVLRGAVFGSASLLVGPLDDVAVSILKLGVDGQNCHA